MRRMIIGVASLVVTTAAASMLAISHGEDSRSMAARTPAEVIRVYDGDTFLALVKGQQESVRIVGVDTPETVDPRRPKGCYGPEASAYVKKTLPKGMIVLLSVDPTQGDRDNTARHRLLRNVQLPTGQDVSVLLARNGYATQYTYKPSGPPQNAQVIAAAVEAAKEAKVGMWGVKEDGTPVCPVKK